MMHRSKILLSLASAGVIFAANGCGTGTEDGLCKPTSSSGVVAATADTNGKPWTIKTSPEGSYTQNCASPTDTGTLRVVAVIRDSLETPKAGLVINGSFGNISDNALALTAADANTDSCGTAMFDIQWKCPTQPGTTRGANLVINSGALSASIMIDVTHMTVEASSTEDSTSTE
jgi:hypothetical protein